MKNFKKKFLASKAGRECGYLKKHTVFVVFGHFIGFVLVVGLTNLSNHENLLYTNTFTEYLNSKNILFTRDMHNWGPEPA
jgi:hypothetical protein